MHATLRRHFEALHDEAITLSFDEIDAISGGRLPVAARVDITWWANETADGQVSAWADAGYKCVCVSMASETAVFIRD